MIKVFEAANITEAHIVRGMLEAHGIEAHVGGHYLQGGVGELAVQGFALVLVNDEEEVRALELIREYDKSD